MIRKTADGLVFYQFGVFAEQAPVQHAIFTRLGGRSRRAFHSLNVGHSVGDDPAAVQANHDLLWGCLGLAADQVVTAHQVHGGRVAVVGGSAGGTVIPATDALISNQPGTALLLRFADCVPLFLYDPQRRAIGLVHAGWRGFVAGVVPNAVAALREAFSCRPQNIMAGVGPAIGWCCYQVGADLCAEVQQVLGTGTPFLRVHPDGTLHFDLSGAVRWQLQELGVCHIEESGICTACHTDEFFSHRAEKGTTGRFAAVLALRETL